MIIEIRYGGGLQVRLLKVYASLFFLIFLRLEIHECVMLLVDFNWLSYLWLMLPSTQSALDADEVTSLQWRIAPQTWHEEWEKCNSDPAFWAAHFIHRVIAARAGMIYKIAFGVTQTVIQHTACAHHSWYRLNSTFYTIRCMCTWAFLIPLLLIELLTISKNEIL
jgi:hypothetical protein